MKIRHIIILSLFVAINVVVLATLNFGSNQSNNGPTENNNFIQTVKAIKVHNAEDTFKITGFGTVSSFNAVDLSTEVSGKLSKGNIPLKPGTSFRKGQLIFTLNDTDARYNLRARKSGFINIIANLLPDLKIDFPTEYKKWENYIATIKLNENLPSLPAWKTNKEKIFLSTRNVLTEYFTIKSLEEQLRKYAVYAPFNGVITDAYVTNYAVVGLGTRIIRIAETDNFEIPVSIQEEQLKDISIGTTVSIYSTTGTPKGKGTIIRISEVINKATQSVQVYIRPKALKNERFIEGEYVKVEIDELGTHKGIRIPKEAVYDNTVYMYSIKDSTLHKRPVIIADVNEEGYFIKGLEENGILVAQTISNYTDTTKYQVLLAK